MSSMSKDETPKRDFKAPIRETIDQDELFFVLRTHQSGMCQSAQAGNVRVVLGVLP